MKHVFRTGYLLAAVDGHGAAGVRDDHACAVLHALDHVVQEQVGLAFHRVGADKEDGVRPLVVCVIVVQLVDAHVAAGMHFRHIGRAVVDAAVLDLHRLEVQLPGAPGVLITTSRSAVVEHRDVKIVFVVLIDHPRRHPCHKIKRIVPGCRLPCAIAPDQRLGQTLFLGSGHVRAAVFGHAGTADRAEARVHDTIHIRLDHQVNRPAVLANDVVHRGRIPVCGLGRLLCRQILARPVVGEGALLVHRPSVGLVAATDDAIVARGIVDLRIGRNDRQPVDLSFESHFSLPQTASTLDRRP